jgi:hypothetical protein
MARASAAPSAPPGLESLPQMLQLPRRLRQIVGILLTHMEQICQPDIGSLELHFYRDARTDSVKAKLVQHLKK